MCRPGPAYESRRALSPDASSSDVVVGCPGCRVGWYGDCLDVVDGSVASLLADVRADRQIGMYGLDDLVVHARIERVSQAVAQERERQHRERDGNGREDGHVPV